jgi:hypothetical protein
VKRLRMPGLLRFYAGGGFPLLDSSVMQRPPSPSAAACPRLGQPW